MLMCDFCTAPDPYAEYAAADFRDPHVPTIASTGAWCACRVCYELIEQDQWDRLSMRSARRYMKQHGGEMSRLRGAPVTTMEVFQDLRTVHAKFREFRTAKPHIYTTEERRANMVKDAGSPTIIIL